MAISPILGIDSDALPDKVLVVGDPGQVEEVGEYLTDPEWLGRNRNTTHSLVGTATLLCRGVPWSGSARQASALRNSAGLGQSALFEWGPRGAAAVCHRRQRRGARAAVREDGLSPKLVPQLPCGGNE